MTIGRPLSFTPEVGAEICSRMTEGETLRQICRDERMPAKSNVMRWLYMAGEPNAVPELVRFRDQYATARQELLEHWADEIIEISDDGSNDWMERETKRGTIVRVFDHEHASRSKLRVDTRRWLMSKLGARKYGQKIEITTPQGAPLQVVNLTKDEFTDLAKQLTADV